MYVQNNGSARAADPSQTTAETNQEQHSTEVSADRKPFKMIECEDMRKLALFPPLCASIWLYYRSFTGKEDTSWAKRANLLKIGGGIDKETLYKYRALLVEFGWLNEVGTRRRMIVFQCSIGRAFGSQCPEIPDSPEIPDKALSGNSAPEVDMKEHLYVKDQSQNLSRSASHFERMDEKSADEVESKPDSASKKKPVPQTVSVNLSVDEKETPTLPAPSEAGGLVLRRDPRHAEFKAAIAEVFRVNGWQFHWTTPGTDDKLDELLEADRGVTVQQFGGWLQKWAVSEDHPPGEHPKYFLPRIHGYSISSIDRHRRPHIPQFTDPGLTFEQFCRELDEVVLPERYRVMQDWELKYLPNRQRRVGGIEKKILEEKRLSTGGI